MATATAEDALELKQADVVQLMKDLGKESAGDWPVSKLKERISKIPGWAEADPEAVEKLGEPEAELLAQITEAVENGTDFTLKSGAAKKAKPEKATKAGKAGKKKAKGGKPASLEKAGKPGQPGILATIKELLENASKDKPITREEITDKLVKKFPGRERAGMRVTVFSQIPRRFINKGVNVKGDDADGGFWISKGTPKGKKSKKSDDED